MLFRSDGRLLDYGCADVPYRRFFQGAGDYVAADLAGNPNATLVLDPNGSVPEPEESFDAVLSTQVLEHVNDMTTVDDAVLLRTMFLLWERLKLMVEPTGALGAAAALQRGDAIRGKRVGVILSGGNVDVSRIPGWLTAI